jgi:hypothetical protein
VPQGQHTKSVDYSVTYQVVGQKLLYTLPESVVLSVYTERHARSSILIEGNLT